MSPTVKTHRKAMDRGRKLEYFTIGWNIIETAVAVIAGAFAGSISMIGFGIDSSIEAISGGALLWRMAIDHDDPRRKHRERIALKVVSICFIALAAYICIESILSLVHRNKPETSIVGIVLASGSLIVMPYLSRQKKKVARELQSRAMRADARQSKFSLYLSGILLASLIANTAFGWWWADPVAGLAMVPLIAKEGLENLRVKP
jgi:divalent metal cation (Fe/Co/Zn/Cd) transporter